MIGNKVYVLTHIPTGKKYVGSTEFPTNRLRQHITALKSHRHKNQDMQNDYDRYGGEYKFEIVDTITQSRKESEEYKWMRMLKTYLSEYGYNTKDWSMNEDRKALGLSAHSGNNRTRAT